jgi:signal peptidase II
VATAFRRKAADTPAAQATLTRCLRLSFARQPVTSGSISGMNALSSLLQTPNRRIALIAALVVVLDQLTKQVVLRLLGYAQEKVVIDGFFKFVHWGNTGAAWSMFRGNNGLLAGIALLALLVLFLSRHYFDSRTLLSQVAFGLIFGGIVGNLIDRLRAGHVIDFLYFYLQQRDGSEASFPAFNVADSAICTGVGLVFLITWRSDRKVKPVEPSPSE